VNTLVLFASLFLCTFGGLIDFRYSNRLNKLYVPASPQQNAALFVMLHGCTQDPLDFFKGTDMGPLAEKYGFYVLYLQQPSSANFQKCWNWFLPLHQARNLGEPKFIHDATKEVMKNYNIDPSKVSVSGISAGGAMTVIMGATYPDLFCCIGVASGLEYKAATTQMGAFTAMSSGGPAPTTQGKVAWEAMKSYWKAPIQTVVFHGTIDYTVRPVNGEQTTIQWVVSNDLGLKPGDGISTTPSKVENFQVPGGHAYKVLQYDDIQVGVEIVQHVIVEGMGHAWSGGSSAGSYTDPKGPSMSQMIVDTFLNWDIFGSKNMTVEKKFTNVKKN